MVKSKTKKSENLSHISGLTSPDSRSGVVNEAHGKVEEGGVLVQGDTIVISDEGITVDGLPMHSPKPFEKPVRQVHRGSIGTHINHHPDYARIISL